MPKPTKFPRENFTISANGHFYYITHLLPMKTPRVNELWSVIRDSKDIKKAKLFRTKVDMLKHYPNLRGMV